MGIFEGIEKVQVATQYRPKKKIKYQAILEHMTFKEMLSYKREYEAQERATNPKYRMSVRGPTFPSADRAILTKPKPDDHWDVLEWMLGSVLQSLGGYKYLSYKGVPIAVTPLASGDEASVSWYFRNLKRNREWRGLVVRHPFPRWDRPEQGHRFETPWQVVSNDCTGRLLEETIEEMRIYQLNH